MGAQNGLRTVSESLAWARAAIGAVDARVLLCHVTGWNAAALIARGDRALSAPLAVRFEALVARRQQGEPVAYLTGEREFYGRLFRVTPAVLIPRPETELLVELALGQRGAYRQPRVLDLGTGSGILAITLALEWPESTVCAVDCARDALWVAMANAARLGASVSFIESDWFANMGADRFDLILANPPYVAQNDAHLQAGDVRFEPQGALASGPQGLDALGQIIADAPAFLEEGGWLMLEHGYDQAAAVRSRLVDAGFVDVESWKDLAGTERVSGGRRLRREPLP
ncbi:MAG: peptide chain release factor N(5)-glutamine methyltransferase [Zoogloeaceae bacterium]|nr:peptide chain release factor N(5)-glutamine methyltransferase [Zoogloeaceae bacterium]